ncbi:MAG: toxin-antitoxin system HicB family antitoxin [Pyrinomonadaceae bacterium]
MTNKTAADFLKLPYTRILTPDEDGVYVAEILEFQGCYAEGATASKALKNLDIAAKDWIMRRVERGLHIPEPMGNREMSGRFALRMPESLHEKAAIMAERDGVSLNTFIVSSIAMAVGREDVLNRVMKSLEAFRANLRPVIVFMNAATTSNFESKWKPEVRSLMGTSATSAFSPLQAFSPIQLTD